MDTTKYIRKLARSIKYQNLYTNSSDLGFKMFKNNGNLTDIQNAFLYWCSVYNSLYEDLAMQEDYINKDIIESDIRTDAYLLYRKKKREQDAKKNKKEYDSVKNDKEEKIPHPDLEKVVFY
jgi:hypothetical protein